MRRRSDRHPGVVIRRTLLAGLFLCLLLLSPAALAAGDGIAGKVVNGTHGGAVAGLEVTLHEYRGQGEVGSRTATTDRNGAFAFPGLEADAEWSYQVTTTFRGADYQTRRLQLTPGEATVLTLKVYDPTQSPENVTVTNWVVWLDREGGGTAVQHDLEIDNSGKTTYVGSEPLGGDKRLVMQVPLAPDAGNFQYLGTFMECCAVIRDGTFIHTMPIRPGLSQATLRYTAGSLSHLSFPAPFPTKNFSLLVPAGIEVAADELAPAGQTVDRGITYEVFSATDLAAGEAIEVSLTGLEGGGRSPVVLALMGMGVVAAAGALIVWRLGGRATGVPKRDRMKARPAASARAVSQVDGAGRPGRIAEGRTRRVSRIRTRPTAEGADVEPAGEGERGAPEEEAALLIDEIAALDLAFERGFLDRSTYERLRTATKARLLRLRSGGTGNGPPR